MDWSLVLASQGIEADLVEDEFGYFLLVDEEDYAAARSALRAYERENPRGRRVEVGPDLRLKLHFGAVVWALFLVFLYWRQSTVPGMEEAWLMMGGKFVSGEWWRPLTAIGLHQDIAHLASNLTFGILFLTLAMEAYGVWIATLLSLAAGVFGNLLGCLVYPPDVSSLGASGMVMGALGMLGAYSALWRWRQEARFGAALRGALAAALMLALIGFSPQSDMVAHVGGFLFGAGAGAVWLATKRKTRRREQDNRHANAVSPQPRRRARV
jgi:membrane associated rhomboid family serine protease